MKLVLISCICIIPISAIAQERYVCQFPDRALLSRFNYELQISPEEEITIPPRKNKSLSYLYSNTENNGNTSYYYASDRNNQWRKCKTMESRYTIDCGIEEKNLLIAINLKTLRVFSISYGASISDEGVLYQTDPYWKTGTLAFISNGQCSPLP